MGKLESTSSPPIQKMGSWGSSSQLPHHLYRREARGEVVLLHAFLNIVRCLPPPVTAAPLWHAVAVVAFRAGACARPSGMRPVCPPSPPPALLRAPGPRPLKPRPPRFVRRCQLICAAGPDKVTTEFPPLHRATSESGQTVRGCELLIRTPVFGFGPVFSTTCTACSLLTTCSTACPIA